MAAGGEERAIGGEGDGPDGALVGAEAVGLFLFRQVPEFDGAVMAAGGEPRAVGREGDVADPVLVPFHGELLLAGGVEDPDFAVRSAGGQFAAVFGVGNRPNGIAMPFQLAFFRTVGHIPELAELIRGASGERRPVGRKRQVINSRFVGLDGFEFLGPFGFPNNHVAVLARGGEVLAVSRDGDAAAPALVLIERRLRLLFA